jgi:hypothetical protein
MKRTILLISGFLLLVSSCTNNDKDDQQVNSHINSLLTLKDLQLLLRDADAGIRDWISIPGNSELKPRHQKRMEKDYPFIKNKLNQLSNSWSKEERGALQEICTGIAELFNLHQGIMEKLGSFDSYERPEVLFSIREETEPDGDLRLKTAKINEQLEKLVKTFEDHVKQDLAPAR